MIRRLFILLSIISVLVFLSGCGKSQNESQAFASDNNPEKTDLQVLFVSPKGATAAPHEAETIVIVFNQPMIPLEALSEDKPSFLKIEPSYSGRHRWLNPKTLTFIPEKRLPYSTEIKVTIPAGTKSLQDSVLEEDFAWSFRTILPSLLKHFPHQGQKWMKLDTQILLIFNQSVSKEKAKDFIALVEIPPEKKEMSLAFSLSYPTEKQLEEEDIKAKPEEVLLLVPEQKLKPDFSYYVEIKEGLPGKGGPLGMEKSRLFKFETFKKFAFEKLDVAEKHNPHDPLPFFFSNPVRYNDFVQKIRFEPFVAIPDYYSEWTQPNSKLWLSLPLEPETEYTAWIDAQLEDEFGNKLGQEIELHFITSSYPSSVHMNTGHGVIEAYGDLRYPFYTVNTKEVFLQGALVQKEEVIPLLQTERLFWAQEKFSKENFFRVEKRLELSPQRNKRQILPIELKEILANKHGLIFLQLDTHLPEKWNHYPKAFLQVTELGLSGKFSPENNLIWVTELRTGQPVSDASVEIRDDFNKIRWQGKTDDLGKVQTPGWRSLGIKSKSKWSKPRQWVIVGRGQDIAFFSSEWETGIYPYRFGIQYDWNPQPVKIQAYIFTEKGIYRAGEEVHIKGIIRKREKGEWELPSLPKIECEISDPFQKSVFKKKIELDSFGSFAVDFKSEENASLGYYQIKAIIPPLVKGEKPTPIYSSFRIEAFQPARFEVHLRAFKESFIFGDTYQAEIRANYLFGGAMANQRVKWHLRFNPASYSPPGHDGYIFGNQIDRWEDLGRERSRLLSSGESNLDADGKFKLSAKLIPEKEKDSVLAALESTVTGPSRRSISSRIQTMVHRGQYYIGLRPHTTFLKKGEEIEVLLITVSPDGEIIPDRKVRLALIKREWQSVRRKGMGGRYLWKSETKDTEISAQNIQTKKESQKVTFLPEKSGFYILQAEGYDSRDNKIMTTTYFYVTGKDYVPWHRRDDDTIELVSDREEYRPGDVAKVLVKSPYEKANVLVTVERELILENKILQIQGSSYEIEIPLDSDHIPNVYVSVLLVQGRTSPRTSDRDEDIGKPSFKIGYINLKVDPSEKRLKIDIQKEKDVYKPREEVHLKLKVEDWEGRATKASLTLAVVDYGVLSLIGYQTPDAFPQFYSEKPLAVQTSDTRLHLIGQREYGEKGDDVGGGGREMMKAAAPAFAEVELRGEFKATAYWNPAVLADEDGTVSVSFTLPDNLTTFRIMALAQTADSRFGSAEDNFRTSKPLMLIPALPRFARIGDRFEGGVTVHNYTSSKGKGTLSCEATGISLLDKNNTRRFSLAAGEGKEILYSFEVKKTGKATVAFKAQMGKETDGLEISFPLQRPRQSETVALFDKTSKSKQEKIKIPKEIYAEESKIEFLASSSALAGLRGSVDYLTAYPYLCLEQRLSSILPYLVAYEVILDFNLSKLDKQEIQEHVKKNLQKIYDYQREDGGFGLWPDSVYDSPFLSCYAVFALVRAKKAGYEVNIQRLRRAESYLQILLRPKPGNLRYPYSSRSWKTVQAFALYCLALLDKPKPAYAEKLFVEREQLSLFGKTLLLKAFFKGGGSLSAQNALVEELLNKIKATPTKAHFEDDEGRGGGWIYSSTTRTTAFILQSLIEIDSDNTLIPAVARWLVEKRKARGWHSTQENFFVFYALNDFYQKYEKIKPDFKVEISLQRKRLLEEIFKERSKISSSELSLASFPRGKIIPLKINLKGEGTLYYETRMTYTPQYKLYPTDEGFGLSKEILSLEGKPLESVKAGSLVVVKLQIVAPRESLFVVVDDPLPAGFEAVNPTFITESREDQLRLQQLGQKKREGWWRGFNHIEMYDDRLLLFADSLAPGIHTHRYLARALTFGTFQTPATKVEEMYSPEVFGRSEEWLLKIYK